MFHDWKKSWAPPSRRQFLACLGEGFGTLVLSHLLLQDELRAQGPSDGGRPDLNGGLHHRARAKRVIQLFMNGGVSQSDTFDYKPQLIRYSGQKFDPGPGLKVESVTGSPGFIVMKSPFTWKHRLKRPAHWPGAVRRAGRKPRPCWAMPPSMAWPTPAVFC